MSRDKTILDLGAGIGAIPVVRQTMVNIVLKDDNFKLVLVAPNTHFHWPISMPRTIVPVQHLEDKTFIPLTPTFSDYPPQKFSFVRGKAVSLDPESNSVTVGLAAGGSLSVPYHTLIIAIGARARARGGMPWKCLSDTLETRERLYHLQDQIAKAKSIVVAGGGLTAVEIAGELGYKYSQHGTKEVILVYNDRLPLAPPATDSVRSQVKLELERLKVKLISDTTVTSHGSHDGTITLQLKNAEGSVESISTEAYLPAFGLIPNTDFMPEHLLDDRKYIKQTTKLQVEGHSNIFVIGDAGSLESSNAIHADKQAVHLIKALPSYFAKCELAEYRADSRPAFGIALGPSRGVGQVGNWRVYSILVWFMKGRYLGTDYSPMLATGKRTSMTIFEK
ncbi:unnamed protein product [Clonostachys chloroleuca]|uniref:FAD/NAD(P)-binding domain-containing protein n=1 Tax=Clonostachys chloroleuca TaxID=1926264 RepID=A0AA35M9A8_9HYPO|nr:unnamed protein product [Clonostachys chloroleuca]